MSRRGKEKERRDGGKGRRGSENLFGKDQEKLEESRKMVKGKKTRRVKKSKEVNY